jgi:hypothetical protein
LHVVEKELANFIGPLARLAVKRASARTNDLDALYDLLAASVANADDKQEFLAGKIKMRPGVGARPSAQSPSHLGAPRPGSRVELTQPAIEQAARLLARHLGPLAGILAKRASQRAESLHSLYELLAQHIDSKSERERFLHDGGFPDAQP